MASADIPFACACGQVHGTLHDITPKSAGQLQCHCDDCRRAVIWLGEADPGSGGIGYLQTTPSHMTLASGALKAFIWKNKRLLRWYAPCCNTHMFNTLDTPNWPFASFNMKRLNGPSPLGDMTIHGFVRKPNGKIGHDGMLGFMWGFAKRTLRARLSGKWRDTSLFDAKGMPTAPVQILTHEDRAKAQI